MEVIIVLIKTDIVEFVWNYTSENIEKNHEFDKFWVWTEVFRIKMWNVP